MPPVSAVDLSAALEASVGTMARRRTRVVFAPLALILIAVAMVGGFTAVRTTLFAYDDAQRIARLALTLFSCSVPFAAVLALRAARKRRRLALELVGKHGPGALAPMIAKARAEEARGAGWSRIGLALALGWLYLGIVAFLDHRPQSLRGAGLVAAALLLVSALSGSWLRYKLARGADPSRLTTPARWAFSVVILGFALAIWQNPLPAAHLGALVAWLAILRQARSSFCASLVNERAALAATPERMR
jgi:hypothetical protein